jgi:hypothetical protein
MLAWSWFMLWATSFPASSGWLGFARDPLLIAYFGVNFLQAVVGNGVLAILIDAPGAVKGSVASVAVWLLWFGVIRIWIWRKALSADSAKLLKY